MEITVVLVLLFALLALIIYGILNYKKIAIYIKLQLFAEQRNYVHICPQCAGLRHKDARSVVQKRSAAPMKYECIDCGYVGNIFPEVKLTEVDSIQFLQRNKSSSESDVSDVEELSHLADMMRQVQARNKINKGK